MIWEVQKGRACDTALNFALQTIEAKNVLAQSQAKLIDLRGAQIQAYADLDANWSLRLDNAQDLFTIEKTRLKTKIKRWVKIAVFEGGVIVILLVLL